MAERRMISKKVVCTDRFLALTEKAQLLYYYLVLEADDDGFVGNPRAVFCLCGANKRSLALLIEKGYVEYFDSGVLAITHWKMQNRIEARKYTPTIYREELTKLGTDDNCIYYRK